jgi:hypothetical protein
MIRPLLPRVKLARREELEPESAIREFESAVSDGSLESRL